MLSKLRTNRMESENLGVTQDLNTREGLILVGSAHDLYAQSGPGLRSPERRRGPMPGENFILDRT